MYLDGFKRAGDLAGWFPIVVAKEKLCLDSRLTNDKYLEHAQQSTCGLICAVL